MYVIGFNDEKTPALIPEASVDHYGTVEAELQDGSREWLPMGFLWHVGDLVERGKHHRWITKLPDRWLFEGLPKITTEIDADHSHL